MTTTSQSESNGTKTREELRDLVVKLIASLSPQESKEVLDLVAKLQKQITDSANQRNDYQKIFYANMEMDDLEVKLARARTLLDVISDKDGHFKEAVNCWCEKLNGEIDHLRCVLNKEGTGTKLNQKDIDDAIDTINNGVAGYTAAVRNDVGGQQA
jgi:hypothetical protein